eukprot:CAMPEP_0194752136 /NCGR_PEP_ID=MMETSP0323_2-20130528/5969_1 /TAXON_ID=2866 ORGANISM="Crypthecodinium cohnii, Strain Seligo" /NCGR_SAMPLE_ID=MMETSP0323_2 /ASSEMBLY_ACC=CAM_ASM_000346 /LENGTH=32 /DNA_ID= /DNA_START= /DNA_END= /DNA_ORIENTATION=
MSAKMDPHVLAFVACAQSSRLQGRRTKRTSEF